MNIRNCLLLFLIFSHFNLYGQLLFNGIPASYDKRTDTWLVSVPEMTGGGNITGILSAKDGSGWENIMVEGQSAETVITFPESDTLKSYALSYSIGEKDYSSGIQFTSLPIIHLYGDFGYDYQHARVCLTTPDGEYQEMLADIKWRGGTTNMPDKHKRNYKLKLVDEDGNKQNRSFFSLRKDNVWILDAGQVDMFRLRNLIAAELWNDFACKPYYASDVFTATRGQVVEVFLNDEYAGIYNLCEPIDRKQVGVRKFEEETGIIHGGLWKATGWSVATFWNNPPSYDNTSETWDVFELKYPKIDDLCPSDWSTLYNAIDFVVTSSDQDFGEQIAGFVDIPAFIDYYIYVNVLNGWDFCAKNIYWAVYDKETDKKITPVMWDLDCTVGQNYVDEPLHPDYVHYTNDFMTPTKIGYRLKLLDPDNYNQRVADRYRQLREGVLATDSLTERYRKYYNLISESGAACREAQRWSGDTDIAGLNLDFAHEFEYIKDWIEHRMPLLDDYFGMKSSIRNISRQDSTDNCYYNLMGQRLSEPTKGLVITKGKKLIVK